MMEETKSTLTKEKGIDQMVYEKIHEIKTSTNRPYYAKMEKIGKMFVRDKIKYLVDEDSFEVEDGLFARCKEEDFLPG